MNSSVVSAPMRNPNVDVMHVPMAQPLLWLQRGWRDMWRHWGASLGQGALIVALGWTLLIFCGTHPYYVAAAITAFLLVAPVMSAGFSEMSRRFAAGQPASFDDSLAGFGRNQHALFTFGAILGLIGIAWFAVSAVMLSNVFHVAAPSVPETVYIGFIDSLNRAQVSAYVAVGGALALVVFTLSVVTVPLIIDRQASAGYAMKASVRAVFANIPAMILWSALILALTLVGYAPLLFGLLLVSPLLGHATWHAYRDLIRT